MRSIIVAAVLSLAASVAQAQAHMLSDCAGALDRAAASPSERRTAEPARTIWAHTLGLASVCSARRGDFKRAEDLFTAMLDGRPSAVEPFALPLLRTAAQRNGDPAMALRLLDLMRDRRKGADRPHDLDRVIRLAATEEAAALVLLGRADEAWETIERSKRSPQELLALQVDRRFEPAWESEQAVTRRIAEDIERVLANDKEMRAFAGRNYAVGTARWALMAGRPDLALELLSGKGQWTILSPGADPIAPRPRDDERAYLWLRLMLLSGDLGEWTKAAGPREPVRDAWTGRGVKLLAMALVRADRPAEAVDLLDRSAPYLAGPDAQELPLLRACAAARAGRTADAPSQAPFATLWWNLDALLCAERMDDAAALIVENLADPDRRVWALRHLQRYQKPPLLGAFDAQLRRRRDEVLKRPEVKAAIEREGRLLTLPIHEPD